MMSRKHVDAISRHYSVTFILFRVFIPPSIAFWVKLKLKIFMNRLMNNRKNKIQLVLRLVEGIFSREQSQTANVHFVKITDFLGESMSMFPKKSSLPSETILRILHLPEH